MFRDIEAVIFDMDGTIIDSMWIWRDIDVAYLKKHNIELPIGLQKEIDGMSFSQTAEYFKRRFKISDELEDIKKEWNDMASEYYKSHIEMKEGALELIEDLSSRGIVLSVASSNSRLLIEIIMERFGLGKYIKSITTSCEVEKGKPAPDVFLEAASRIGVTPDRCLVFEDVPNGIIAAKAAGMKCCAVYDDFSKELDDEKRDLSDYYVNSFFELMK